MIRRMGIRLGKRGRTSALTILASGLLLAGCATRTVEPARSAPRDMPINSLALEQCLGVNGPEACG